jgi:putative ABC transport system permease protein
MLRATLRTLWSHKLRLLLSGAAVVLGVAFVSGTLVFTDTLQKTFNDLFTQVSTDVTVTPKTEFSTAESFGAGTASLPAAMLDTVRGVDGVAKAEGSVFTGGVVIVGKDGKPVGTPGAPSFGVNWSDDPDLSPLRLVQGRGPETSGEVAIDSQSADKGGFAVGDRVTLLTSGPRIEETVVGIFRYGSTGNLAGASIAAFDLATAQRLLLEPGHYTSIDVKAKPGVSQDTLAGRVRAVLPADQTVVKTGQQVIDESAQSVSDGLRFVNIFLLVFALVALFVGTFIILNTFSMLVAQRTRELALLRAVGATRRQVARSVLGEAAVVGLLGGVTGLLLGVLLALGLRQLFKVIGFDIPSGGLELQPRTVVVAVLLGLVVTVVAAYLPARRASRVPPVAALRADVTVPSRSLRLRLLAGVPLAVVGVAALVASGPANGSAAATLVGVGALLTLVGAITLSPVLSAPVIGTLGAPWRRSATGRLAVLNAQRNPRRTASTASALMIGLALVTAFGVLGASTTASTDAVLGDVLKADYVVSGTGFQPFSPDVAKALAAVPGVGVVSRVQTIPAMVAGERVAATAVDPATVLQTVNLTMTEGSVAALSSGGLAVDSALAKTHGYRLGQSIDMTFQEGVRPMVVVGIYDAATGFNGYAMALQTARDAGVPDVDSSLYVTAAPGVDAASLRPAVDAALQPFPNVRVQDQTEFKAQIRGQINQLLSLIYALLALAVFIAVLGIVNTLVLSVVERTREIGLLRAVGTTRRQLRRMIRVESVVIAVFGALLGVVLGLVFGVALQRAIADQGISVLSVPWVLLLAFLVVAALVGVLAALWPARRASRLDVLQAVTTE